MAASPPEIDLDRLEARIAALPGIERVREAAAAAGVDVYLVGGSVRDALLGRERADLDVAVEGDHLALARALGGAIREHGPFLTATVSTPEGDVDVAATRAEEYPRPGALPVVRPAGLAEDLGRRDFSINAIAVPLRGEATPIDPHGGIEDLRRGVLRVLHTDSIADDPTRALRAARYAARLGLELEPRTATLVRAADLETISSERLDSELRAIAAEPRPGPAFALLGDWGLLSLPDRAPALIDAIAARAGAPPWRGLGAREAAILALVREQDEAARALAALRPSSPSAAVAAARGLRAADLLLARVLGAEWLDEYLSRHREVRLEITGRDLIAAGIAPGPAIGAGLAAALRAKLDGEAAGREGELAIALEAARQNSR